MQIPKISLLVCALALGAAMTTPAADTPAQAAARAAMEAKLKELNAQCPATNTVETPTAVKKGKSAPAKNDAVMKLVSSETKPVTSQQKTQADKAAAEAKAKQDAAQAAAQLKAKKEAQAAADAKADADKKAQKAAAKAKAKQDAAQLKAKKEAQAAADAKAAAEKKTKAEAEKKLAELKQAEANAAKPVKVDAPGAELGLHQIAAPPLPIPASKASRLQTLLGKYKTNQITPEEYHNQRAVILAEP